MKKEFYKRHLPHIQPAGGLFFVTYSLYGSIPKSKMNSIKNEYHNIKADTALSDKDTNVLKNRSRKIYLDKIDQILNHKDNMGPHWLKNPEIAKIVSDSLHYWNGIQLDLYAYCIMSNHVHVVFEMFDKKRVNNEKSLNEILHSIKRYSANKANKILNRTGQFWMNESYDYLIKNEKEIVRIIEYTLDNPIKAGICKERSDWKWSYVNNEYRYLLEW